MVEPILDYNIESYKAWADRYVSRGLRTRLAIFLSALSLLVANFLAFRDEHRLAIEAQNSDIR